MTQNIGWGLLGAATTMVARIAARRAMHEPGGAPRLPRAARHNSSLGMVLLLAAAAGTALAFADVLREQRKHVTQVA